MKLVWRQEDIPELPANAPEKPESALFLWAGIVGAAGGSIFFNTYHDTHSLPSIAVGVLAGFLPPFMAATTIHAVKITRETWVKVCVFLVTVAAMIVSAKGAAQVLGPAYQTWGSYLFSFVLDSADLLLLYALMQHYEKVSAYQKWVKAWIAAQGTVHQAPADGTGTAGTGRVAPSGAGMAPAAGTSAPVPAVPAGGTGTGHRPGMAPTVPGTGLVPVPAKTPAGTPAAKGNGTGQQTAGEKQPGRRQAPAARTQRTADPELCTRVVEKFAAEHPRPSVESIEHQRARAAQFLAEFRRQTGERANNGELGKALGIHPKRQVPEVRAGITEPEGERSDDRQEGTA